MTQSDRLDRIETILTSVAEQQQANAKAIGRLETTVEAWVNQTAHLFELVVTEVQGLTAAVAEDRTADRADRLAAQATEAANRAAAAADMAIFRGQMIGMQAENRRILEALQQTRQQGQ